MDRLDALAEKIDNALRDDESGGAVFDMMPAWAEEYETQNGLPPGTSGGSTLLDHYMREAGMESAWDEDLPYGDGEGVARLGRCLYEWDSAGFYGATLYRTVREAARHFDNIVEGINESCVCGGTGNHDGQDVDCCDECCAERSPELGLCVIHDSGA